MEEEGDGDDLGGHLATLGQHFLAAGAEEEGGGGGEEVSKNTASNYGENREADAATEEVVVGIRDNGDGDGDVTSDFVGEVAPDNNNEEYEDNKSAFRPESETDHRAAPLGGGGGYARGREGGWRDYLLTARRLARARLRREQQATFDGRCGGGDGIGGGGGGDGGKKGQQIGLGGNGEDGDDDDYTDARYDDEEEIEANDIVTCDSNQQVRSGWLSFDLFMHSAYKYTLRAHPQLFSFFFAVPLFRFFAFS